MRNIILTSQGKALLDSGSVIGYQDGLLPTGYKRLTGIGYDGNVYYDTGLYLHGSDTLRFEFEASKACNVLGCYTSADAQTNYSYYATTTSSGKYMRYNGGTYNSYIVTNKRYDIVVTPTGCSGGQVDSTWTSKTFTTASTLMLGTTSYGATSAKLTGKMHGDVVIDGTAHIMACEDPYGRIGYYILEEERFLPNLGTGTPTSLGYLSE